MPHRGAYFVFVQRLLYPSFPILTLSRLQVVRVYDTIGKTYLAMKVRTQHQPALVFKTKKPFLFNQHSRGRRCVTLVAPQIIKNKRAFHEQAQVEIQMLQLFKNFGEVSESEQGGARRPSHAAGNAQSPLHCSNAGLLRVQESSVHRYAFLFLEIWKHFVVKSSSFLYCFACSSLSIPSLPAFQLRSF